eukprot:250223-Rhodomonas_salina.4
MGAPVTYGKSLNKEFRKRELMRITEENMQILRRIQSKEPHYSHLEWEEQAKRDEEYLRNCAEYPMSLPQNTGGSFSKPNSRRGSRRAPMYQVSQLSATPLCYAYLQYQAHSICSTKRAHSGTDSALCGTAPRAVVHAARARARASARATGAEATVT